MSLIDQSLKDIGISPNADGAIGSALGASRNFSKAIDQFQADQAGKPFYGPVKSLNDVIRSKIPPILRNNPNQLSNSFESKQGDWTAIHYADDLIAHAPKLKFLFKVKFEGLGDNTFYYYVHRCDKPNVTFNHQDVNYYSFRTRVLTSVTYHPLSITFLDEIGNSVNDFYTKYVTAHSGQGNGQWGINQGFSKTSSRPYKTGYSTIKAITIEQIFANGLYMNQFKFLNPRIESFQFDELNMEDNAGSMATIQFSYDSILNQTFSLAEDNESEMYTWGNTDLLMAGGSSGFANAGKTSLNEGGRQAVNAKGGFGVPGLGLIKSSSDALQVAQDRFKQATSLPGPLKIIASIPPKTGIDSSDTTISKNILETLARIQISTPEYSEAAKSYGVNPGQIETSDLNPNASISSADKQYYTDYSNATWIKQDTTKGVTTSTAQGADKEIDPFPDLGQS